MIPGPDDLCGSTPLHSRADRPVSVVPMASEHEPGYRALLQSDSRTLPSASPEYVRLVADFLDASSATLVALDNAGAVVGVLPGLVTGRPPFGPIANSLPFFGSTGGVVPLGADPAVKSALLIAFRRQTEEMQCRSATVITSPFETDAVLYREGLRADYVDDRIAQITRLPPASGSVEQDLFSILHSKTRNLVRKGLKGGMEVTTAADEQVLGFLVETHRSNMEQVGGTVKPPYFFSLLEQHLVLGKQWRLYTAWDNGQPVASLLLLYLNRMVEYFVPVIQADKRSKQPLSVLIFQAMVEAVREGYEWWNWGGTPKDNTSLHHFKERWGAEDHRYSYFVRVFDTSILYEDPSELAVGLPFSYAYPYGSSRYR